MPPEYMQSGIQLFSTRILNSKLNCSLLKNRDPPPGHISVKTDAYAFGVVLMELLTGLSPVDSLQERV